MMNHKNNRTSDAIFIGVFILGVVLASIPMTFATLAILGM